jgi:transposase-like protein
MAGRRDRRTFSTDFKKEILNLVDRGEVTIADLAQKHDLTINMICRWRRELRDEVIDETVASAPRIERLGVDPKYVRQLEDQLRTANEKLGELYIVVDGLKKIQNQTSTKNASSFVVTGRSWDQRRKPAK